MWCRSLAFITAATAAVPFAAAAFEGARQARPDWTLTTNAERDETVASLTLDAGLLIATRCSGGSFDALIVGLPPAADGQEMRDLTMQFGDNPPSPVRWSVGTDPRAVLSDLPAPLARRLRDGGRLQVVVPGAGQSGRNLRYVIDLPPSTVAIDQTLTACGRPTVDPRDIQIGELGPEGLPAGVEWAREPRPSYPEGRTYTHGFATISCLNTPEGFLRDCVVESEYPLGGGFAREALDATRRARIHNAASPQDLLPINLVVYRTNFRMQEDSGPIGRDNRDRRF